MAEQISFNVNAELYENRFGELAVKFPGEKVFGEVGTKDGGSFVREADAMLRQGRNPEEWREMPAHELLYGQGWHLICRMGYINGDENRPALEPEVATETLGARARAYLPELFPEP